MDRKEGREQESISILPLTNVWGMGGGCDKRGLKWVFSGNCMNLQLLRKNYVSIDRG